MLRVCRKGRTACFSLSLGLCQKARPGLTLCSGQGEGRTRLRQQWVFLPCLRLAVRSSGSGCSPAQSTPGASEAPREIGSNQDLKGANISQERGQNPAQFCCFASVPMKNNGSHCQSSWEPRAFFWAPTGKSRLLRGAGSSACHEIPSGTEGGISSQRSKRRSS